MKQIELKLKIHSKTWITPVLLIVIAFFAMAMVSPVNAAPPDPCVTGGVCDQDGDGYIRDHKKCTACEGGLGVDPDDSDCTKPVDGCGGGSSGGYIQHKLANRVIWGKVGYFKLPYETNYSGSQVMRLCGPGSIDPVTNPNPQGLIQYVCHSNADFLYGRGEDGEDGGYWNTVYLDLSALTVGYEHGELNPSGRDEAKAKALCKRLTNEEEGTKYFPMEIIPKKEKEPAEGGLGCTDPPDEYCDDSDLLPNVGRLSMYYFTVDESNDEPCTWNSNKENSCHVTIFTQGYFYNECNDRKCGRRIGIEAFGHVKPAPKPAGGDPAEINPFTQDRVITVEELNGFFMGIGTNRSEANCYLNNVIEGGGGYHYENLVFRTCVDADGNGECDSEEQEP